MKNLFNTRNYCLLIAGLLVWSSCQKDIPTGQSVPDYQYKSDDQSAVNWKPILVTYSQVSSLVPAPDDITSAAYQAELSALKSAMSSAGSDQKSAVQYWGVNSMIRWNEILCQLIAKYNLSPSPNPDGTYGVPNSANPSQYPYYPFTHPPYACRALAYWANASYDALLAAWNVKYQYNREAPFKADATIQPLLPENDLPSYVSEDAVVAAAARTILSAMFPLEKTFIAQEATEAENARMWGGMNVQSDIAIGDTLGTHVAKLFLARASTDGMKNAQVTKPVSDSIAAAAQEKWGWSWHNLETPQRPVGITPFFGKVKPWFIPSVEAVRPPPPPAPGSDEFNSAVDELNKYADHLTSDQEHSAYFWADGTGTYTPAGHWDRIATDYITNNAFSLVRTARVFAYMNTAMEDAGISCWDAKYYYYYPRPSQTVPGLKTLLGIPNFPSYVSGHSMFSGAAAEVLSHFFPDAASTFASMADDASNSRVYARIHYRFDVDNGLTTGKSIGDYSVNVAKVDGAE